MRDLARIGAHTEREWGMKRHRRYLDQIEAKLKLFWDTPGIGARRDDISKGPRAHPAGHHIVAYRDGSSWPGAVKPRDKSCPRFDVVGDRGT